MNLLNFFVLIAFGLSVISLHAAAPTPSEYFEQNHVYAYSFRDLGIVLIPNARADLLARGFINNRGECLIGDRLWLPVAAYGLPAGWTDLRTLNMGFAFGLSDNGEVILSGGSPTGYAIWNAGTVKQFPEAYRSFTPATILADGRVPGIYRKLKTVAGQIVASEIFEPAFDDGIDLHPLFSSGDGRFAPDNLVFLRSQGNQISAAPLDANTTGQIIGIAIGAALTDDRYVIWDKSGQQILPGPVIQRRRRTGTQPTEYYETAGMAWINDNGQAVMGVLAYAGHFQRDFKLYLTQPLDHNPLYFADGSTRTTLPAGMHDLKELNPDASIGDFAQLNGINNRGEIIGARFRNGFASSAEDPGFVWRLGMAFPENLESLNEQAAQAKRLWPRAINDQGQILLVGTNQVNTLNTAIYLMSPALVGVTYLQIQQVNNAYVLDFSINSTNLGTVAVNGTVPVDVNAYSLSTSPPSQLPLLTSTAQTVNLAPGASTQFRFRYQLAQPGTVSFTYRLAGTTADGLPLKSSVQIRRQDVVFPVDILVNSTGDLPQDPTVTCCCDTGKKLADGVTPECTLRAAIEIANKHEGKDTIKFQIPSDDPNYNSGVPLIRPKTELPPINDAAIIDGWSQNSSSLTPPIEVSGFFIRRPAIVDEQKPREYNLNIPGPDIVDWPGAASGFTVKGPGTEIHGLAITQFPLCGLRLEGGGGIVQGCYIGIAADGSTSKVNGISAGLFFKGCGVLVSSSANQIGGTGSKQGNVISGNRGSVYCEGCAQDDEIDVGPTTINQFPQHTGPGILILGQSANGNRIQGNILGPDHTGNRLLTPSPLPSLYRFFYPIELVFGQAAGVFISHANNNEVGGLLPGEGNVIGGTIVGVGVEEEVSIGNIIHGNSIGVGADGVSALRNQVGVAIGASQTTVGGDVPNARNIISASDLHGIIDLAGGRIQGNWIGVNAGEGRAADQQRRGIVITGSHSVVISNIVAFSYEMGVLIYGSGDATLCGNRIFSNAYAGVEVAGVVRNKISQNEIVGNGLAGPAGHAPAQSGIHLEYPDLLINDDFDLDDGANTLQNYPVIGANWVDASGLRVQASLDTSLGIHSYTIEFFASSAASASGYGEGERFLGSVTVNTDLGGRAGIDFTTTQPVAPGEFLTATATDAAGNTSEFSKAVMIQGSTQTPSGISAQVQNQVPGGNGSLHSVSAGTRSNLQLQSSADDLPAPLGDPPSGTTTLPNRSGGSPERTGQWPVLPQAALATGDGNGDGILDSQQLNVVSFPGISGKWITLASPAGTTFTNVFPSGPPDFTNLPSGYTFPLGFVNFTVTGFSPGGFVPVTNFFHDDIDYDTVFAYGPTPDNTSPHWYEFLFTGSVGAKLDLNGFTLTYRDGDVGDHDLKADGQITTTFAAAHKIPPGSLLSLSIASVGVGQSIDINPITLRLATNQVPVVTSVLSWPASATNYTLYFKDDLSPLYTIPSSNLFDFPTIWLPVSDSSAVLNGQRVVTNTAAVTARYYQLRRF
ncbi:MAG: choice-of-anchor U domain-containing protein [Verrucomicrobiota bacterium]